MSGAICSGVVKMSEFKKDPYRYMMAFILPDDKYDMWVTAKKEKNDKEAKMIFKRFAISAI